MGLQDRSSETDLHLDVLDSNAPWTPKSISTTSAADSLAIPVTHLRVAKTTGADAEALTLADGKPGQILLIDVVTDGGGTGTLTPATKTGFCDNRFSLTLVTELPYYMLMILLVGLFSVFPV